MEVEEFINACQEIEDDSVNKLQELAAAVAYKRGYCDAIDSVDKMLCPNRILKSGNATIVFWKDGTKTIVRRADEEDDSDYDAFTAALAIKLFGTNSALQKGIKRITEVQEVKK